MKKLAVWVLAILLAVSFSGLSFAGEAKKAEKAEEKAKKEEKK